MKKILLILIGIAVLSSSCAVHNGLTTNLNNHTTEVVLSRNNFKVIETVQGESQAMFILGSLNTDPLFLPLWDHDHLVGSNADGEFSWVDFTPPFSELSTFYNQNSIFIGSAYPGFIDFYEEGGWGAGYQELAHDNGSTLAATLDLATQQNVELLQLVTWNDFGEGTMIEPTLEFGYTFLEQIQEFTGVAYDQQDLELVHRYYLLRKSSDVNPSDVDEVFDLLVALKTQEARALIASLEQ
jgi:glycoprotein endo-alpha-1,2-mannosidase